MRYPQNIALIFLIMFLQHQSLEGKFPKIFTKKNIMVITTLCSLAGTIFTFAYFKKTINLLKKEIEDLKNNAGIKCKVRFPGNTDNQQLNYVLQQFATKEDLQQTRTGNNFDLLRNQNFVDNFNQLPSMIES